MLAPKNGWLVLSEKFSENSIKTDDSWGCPYDFGHLQNGEFDELTFFVRRDDQSVGRGSPSVAVHEMFPAPRAGRLRVCTTLVDNPSGIFKHDILLFFV